MSRANEITEVSVLVASAAASCVGFAAIWANPRRPINRLFFTASMHVALWLICRYSASAGKDLSMYRVTTAVGAMLHFHLWLIKETVVDSSELLKQKLRRGRWWLLGGISLALICSTEWFIPTPESPGMPHQYGVGYFVYGGGLLLLFCALTVETFRQVKTVLGVQRIELQLLLVGGSATAIVVIQLMVLRSIFEAEWMAHLVPYAVLAFYAVTVVSITTSRVFDARQLLFVSIHRLCLVAIVSAGAYPLSQIINSLLSPTFTLLLVTGFSLWLAGIVRRWLDGVLQYYPRDGSARQAALTAAQQERRVDSLEKSFLNILKGWGQSERSYVCSCPKKSFEETDLHGLSVQNVVRIMRGLKWATPERVARERRTSDSEVVEKFMRERELGALLIEDGLTLSVLVGVGIPASRRPYTYPQVQDLVEIGSIMGSAIERTHFSSKVQHTEQLATVGLLGASLAHEIRNPLVSIKTFVQLLPSHYNEAAFREKFFRLILDEVNRIDQLTDQLLDLASPRAYLAQQIELHSVIRASLDLVATKAAHRQIQMLTDFAANPDCAFTDSSAAKQVIINLCFNAIQAIESHDCPEKWVKVATRNRSNQIEILIVDSGPGIPPEMRPRLFQPFQTTKSTGFGLGLAICNDILVNLNASISVDPSEEGKGATFRIIFPCQPS
jgi:signal transduction histidine kinase